MVGESPHDALEILVAIMVFVVLVLVILVVIRAKNLRGSRCPLASSCPYLKAITDKEKEK